ncbi:hypothetical protein ABPG74_019887 [Tetrahymena malaccensis]
MSVQSQEIFVKLRIIYQIAGDITLNINQLLNEQLLHENYNYNEFIQVKSCKMLDKYQWFDIQMDTYAQVRNNIQIPVQILRNSQSQDLFFIASALEEYQKVLNEKMNQDYELQVNQLTQKAIINQLEPTSQFDCDEQSGWNFEKSLQKAEKVIKILKQSNKYEGNHQNYILFKGNKYDQSISRIGSSTSILKSFYCLNENQISYLSVRTPAMHFYRYQNQHNHELDQYRSEPKLVNEYTFDHQSVDNLCVDNVLWICYHQPIRDQTASQVLNGMRNLRKYLNEEEEKSKLNPFYNEQLYSDIIYEAQSELFRDKFYSIIDNNVYHQISDNF